MKSRFYSIYFSGFSGQKEGSILDDSKDEMTLL